MVSGFLSATDAAKKKHKTILRVFMIYQEADKNTVLEPPIEPSPIRRKGFTVIEWGGQLQK